MNTSQIFSTPERVNILRNIVFETGQINVNEIARETKTSKGLVSKYFNILKDNEIIEKKEQFYQIIENSATKAVRILLNISKIDTKYFTENPVIISAGLFGSAANGNNTKESDIDIWILHKKTTPDILSKITKNLTSIGKTRPVYLTIEKVNELKQNDPIFYYSLIFGSIVLLGEHIDAI